MTTSINIDLYTTKFTEFPPDFLTFAQTHSLKLPGLSSMKGQALALLTHPDVRGQKYLDGRPHATKFFTTLGLLDEKTDPIQCFNKSFGLKMMKIKRGRYCVQFPFEPDTTDLDKRKGISIHGNRDTTINSIKNYWKKILLDVPNQEWQIGHLDPTIDDASEKNLAYQPPIQGKYRNRFKFDEWFLKMWPTAQELAPKFDIYYTEIEQRILYESLKKKFEEKQTL